jgi:Flp pilus assembly protein TadD
MLRRAYLDVVDAELARSEGKAERAVESYRKSLAVYERLQADYPGWQSDVVSYRIADCKNELAALESLHTPDNTSEPVVLPEDETNTMARLTRLLQDLKTVQVVLATNTASRHPRGDEDSLARELARVRVERDQAVRASQALIRKQAKLEDRLDQGDSPGQTNLQVKVLPSAIKNEARKMMEAGDNQGAMVLLQESVALLKNDSEMVVLLGVAACRAGRFEDAVAVLKPFEGRGLTNAAALVTLGTAYMGLGQVGESRVTTEKALEADRRSPEANYNMAQILLMVTPPDPETAELYYRRALELGLAPDADLENTLRIATIMSRIRKRVK